MILFATKLPSTGEDVLIYPTHRLGTGESAGEWIVLDSQGSDNLVNSMTLDSDNVHIVTDDVLQYDGEVYKYSLGTMEGIQWSDDYLISRMRQSISEISSTTAGYSIIAAAVDIAKQYKESYIPTIS